MTDRLLELFRCELLVQIFPRGMSRRSCLRRQLERRREGEDWRPTHPACASGECVLGRETVAATEGIGATWCRTCGAAVIGSPACGACAEQRAVTEVPRRDPERAPPQERLWSGEVPDVPLGPPPAALAPRPKVPFSFGTSTAALEARAKRARAAAAKEAQVTTERPATPAKEIEMPKGHRSVPCKECGSKGTRHLSVCSQAGKPAAKPASPKPGPKAAPARRRLKLSEWAVARSPRRAAPPPAGLVSFDTDELLARREQLVSDLRAVDEAIRSKAAQLEQDRDALIAALEARALVEEGKAA